MRKEREWRNLKELNKYEKKSHVYRYEYAKRYIKGKTLDIGCGSGYALEKDWIGIDIDPMILKVAKKRNNLIIGDFLEIKLKDNTFDSILMIEVIEHIRDKERVIKKIRRILKNNGIVFVSTPNKTLCKVAEFFGWKGNIHDIELLGKKDIINLFKTNGFRLIKSHQYWWLPQKLHFLFPITQYLGKILPPLSYDIIFIFENEK